MICLASWMVWLGGVVVFSAGSLMAGAAVFYCALTGEHAEDH